jgi:predicted amidohydrolase
MVARGARAIFLPSNNGLLPKSADVVALSRAVDIARARDNHVMIVRADVAGRTANRVSFGSSAIVDASGTVLAAGRALSEDILIAQIHPAAPGTSNCALQKTHKPIRGAFE